MEDINVFLKLSVSISRVVTISSYAPLSFGLFSQYNGLISFPHILITTCIAAYERTTNNEGYDKFQISARHLKT